MHTYADVVANFSDMQYYRYINEYNNIVSKAVHSSNRTFY